MFRIASRCRHPDRSRTAGAARCAVRSLGSLTLGGRLLPMPRPLLPMPAACQLCSRLACLKLGPPAACCKSDNRTTEPLLHGSHLGLAEAEQGVLQAKQVGRLPARAVAVGAGLRSGGMEAGEADQHLQTLDCGSSKLWGPEGKPTVLGSDRSRAADGWPQAGGRPAGRGAQV